MKRKFSPGTFNLQVKRSRTGRGLFTLDFIPKGACIIEYTGRLVSDEERDADKGKYLFWTSDTTMINGNIKSNTARFINHSCVPNCEVDIRKRRIYIFALKDLKPGTELNYDYGEEFFDKHIKPSGCKCEKHFKNKS